MQYIVAVAEPGQGYPAASENSGSVGLNTCTTADLIEVDQDEHCCRPQDRRRNWKT